MNGKPVTANARRYASIASTGSGPCRYWSRRARKMKKKSVCVPMFSCRAAGSPATSSSGGGAPVA